MQERTSRVGLAPLDLDVVAVHTTSGGRSFLVSRPKGSCERSGRGEVCCYSLGAEDPEAGRRRYHATVCKNRRATHLRLRRRGSTSSWKPKSPTPGPGAGAKAPSCARTWRGPPTELAGRAPRGCADRARVGPAKNRTSREPTPRGAAGADPRRVQRTEAAVSTQHTVQRPRNAENTQEFPPDSSAAQREPRA